MAKKSHAKRNSHRNSHNNQAQNNGHSDERSRGRNRPRKKVRADSNVIELDPSGTLQTSYSPPRVMVPLAAKNPAQQQYIAAIKQYDLTFGIGPAGTGKSYCAGALAAAALETGRIERIILTRPAVEAGENLGFLPGEVNDKFSVYIDAFRDILNQRLGSGTVNYALKHGRIVAAPLAYMRGKTFDSNTFVILDEAQNTTPAQMKMFLTRIGEDCKVVINGDVAQSDIRGANGLADAVQRLGNLANVHVHEFARADIVRSGLVREIIDCYES
jgi:phosphate starvation-inducible PhoH-like protein